MRNSDVVWIGLANGLEVEAIMASELRDLTRKHDVEPWMLTRKILVDKKQIPHSHPILTIHTCHIGEENELLSTLVHEQLHWLEDDSWLEGFQSAMTDLEALFPVVPSSADGGARDKQSTYRHLLVCAKSRYGTDSMSFRAYPPDEGARPSIFQIAGSGTSWRVALISSENRLSLLSLAMLGLPCPNKCILLHSLETAVAGRFHVCARETIWKDRHPNIRMAVRDLEAI